MAERLTAEELARWRRIAASEGDTGALALLDEIEALRADLDAAVAKEAVLRKALSAVRIEAAADALTGQVPNLARIVDITQPVLADPSPAAKRHMERMAALRAKIASWQPTLARVVDALAAARETGSRVGLDGILVQAREDLLGLFDADARSDERQQLLEAFWRAWDAADMEVDAGRHEMRLVEVVDAANALRSLNEAPR